MAPSLFPSLSVILFAATAFSATTCPPADAICAVASSALRTDTFLAGDGGLAATASAQGCADFCTSVSGCGGFFFDVNILCQLFSGKAAVTAIANPGSVFKAYDISCFNSGSACLSSSSASSTLQPASSSSVQAAAASSSATTTNPVTSCVPIMPTCSASPILDPSFELNDGSWTLNGAQIIAGSTTYPARTGTKLAQFTFSGLGGDEEIYSVSQTLDSLCVNSQYTLTGYYAVPNYPGGIDCNLIVLIGGDQIYSSSINFDTTGAYQTFSAVYTPTVARAELIVASDCTYGPTGAGVLQLDFDDITFDVTTPLPASSCSSLPVPTASSSSSSSITSPYPTSSTFQLISSSTVLVSTTSYSASSNSPLSTAYPMSINSTTHSRKKCSSVRRSSSSAVRVSAIPSPTNSNSSVSAPYPASVNSTSQILSSSVAPIPTTHYSRSRNATSRSRKPCKSVFSNSSVPSTTRSGYTLVTTSSLPLTSVTGTTDLEISTSSLPGSISASSSIASTSVPLLSTTSTIYSTITYTISKCAPTVTNCPYGHTTTQVVAISTTVCPVSAASSKPVATEIEIESTTEGYKMSTVYATTTYTVTSCKPTVTNCPLGSVTTETKFLYTTYCPVTVISSVPVAGGSAPSAVASNMEGSSIPVNTDVPSISSAPKGPSAQVTSISQPVSAAPLISVSVTLPSSSAVLGVTTVAVETKVVVPVPSASTLSAVLALSNAGLATSSLPIASSTINNSGSVVVASSTPVPVVITTNSGEKTLGMRLGGVGLALWFAVVLVL